MKNIWVATKNTHKVEEISAYLKGYKINSLLDIKDFPDVEENGSSYSENAELKARALFNYVKEPVFADDSGLEVDALNGGPGIHSARYSGEPVNHDRNISKLLQELKCVPKEKRTARFRCVIIYIDENGKSYEFSGTLEGEIAFKRSGTQGFGFDPVFFLPQKGCSVAELPMEEKNTFSHRANALKKLATYLNIIKE